MEYAYFNRFVISMSLEQALHASHPGPCDQDVTELLEDGNIIKQLDFIGSHAIRNELEEYGAWDDNELANAEDNRARIIWIAAGDIRENYKTDKE